MKRRLGLVLLVALILAGMGATALAQAPTGALGVYYVGPEDTIAAAIALAEPYLVRVDRPELAQVFVINDVQPAFEDLRLWGRLIQRESVGLVVFCGPNFPTNSSLELQPLLGVSTFGLNRRDVPFLLTTRDASDPLSAAVNWSSAPPLAARTVISNPNLLQLIAATTSGEPAVQRIRGRERMQVFIVDAWLNHASNATWPLWPYYNFIIYRLIAEAGNASRILTFAQYPLSPVPHGVMRFGILGGSLGIVLLALSGFFLARRFLFLHPEQLAGPYRSTQVTSAPDWEQVGFHRPLAGFLYAMTAGALLFVPVLLYQVYLLPGILIPWPQTLDFWNLSGQWLELIWLIFDMGTAVAVVRQFAVLRIYAPREGFRYFQFYIWWQLLSGAAQLGVMGVLAVALFPETALAHLTFYFIVHAFIQFPGFYRVFGLFFRAIQRVDHEQRINFTVWLAAPLFSTVAILLCRDWGARNPAIGEALGAMMGLGVGLYLAELLAFGVGLWLYKRLGYALRPLFAAAFDWRIVRETVSFGGRLAFGNVAVAAALLAQAALVAGFLDYEIWQRAWLLVGNVAVLYALLGSGLYDGLMPALVQAYHQGYQSLSKYYLSQAFRYGMWFSLLALATLAAVGDRFILGFLGEAYAGAAALVFPILCVGLLEWPIWLANRTLEAVGRPALRSWLMAGAQGVRLGLTLVLVPVWGIPGLLWAIALSTLLHGLVAWLWVGRVALRPRIYVWQTFVAPVCAGVLVYNLLRFAGGLVWTPHPWASIALVLATLAAALPLYALLTGFLGGWDDNGLGELRRAARLSGLGFPIGWLVYQCVRLGAQPSPLHNYFSMPLGELAAEDAQALTLHRKPLE